DRLRVRNPTAEEVVATVRLGGVAEVRDALGSGAGTELVRRAIEDLGRVLPARADIGRGAGDDVVVVIGHDPARSISTERLGETTVEQIAAAIGSGRYLVGAIEVTLSTHVGIALATPGDEDAGDILRKSALAARSAQDHGRLVDHWDGGSTTLTAEDLELLAELRTAEDQGELWVAYQPQVSPIDGRTLAVEALLRWSSPVHGHIPPGRFIPLAEQTGLVDRLTDWVVGEALDAQLRWRDAGFEITVSVNVSPLSLRSVDFGDRVRSALARRELPPNVLMLEVTESVAFDIPEAVERLGPLREIGVKISIDDFGTGYTSLAVLPHLPLDELKVDQQFVRDALDSSASEAIVVSVCELAHRLGLTAVAEGVEDEALAHRMASIGFDLLQGYHYARPVPEAELLDRLAAERTPEPPKAAPSEPIAGTVSSAVRVVGSRS
ncbi:MAG: putative bifunctional diguanylate cyclase/phosphodiesterase, partial [Ilumatobacter sp.]